MSEVRHCRRVNKIKCVDNQSPLQIFRLNDLFFPEKSQQKKYKITSAYSMYIKNTQKKESPYQ